MWLPAVLNLYKPKGPSSREVVNRVQRTLGQARVGHAGTLDPLAEGVLVLLLGRATRLTTYVHQLPKVYEAEFWLGHASATDDLEGEVAVDHGAARPKEEQVRRVLGTLMGPLQQIPPAFSAVKVAGERAYRLARRRQPVELAPRPVVVYRLDLIAYEYPRLRLTVECSSGTYLRAVGRDIAAALGTTAVMAELRRTRVGPFDASAAAPWDAERGTLTLALSPPDMAVAHLPRVALTATEHRAISQGQVMTILSSPPSAEVAAWCDGRLVAILTRHAAGWRAKINLTPPTADPLTPPRVGQDSRPAEDGG